MRRAALMIATLILATTPAIAVADWRDGPMNEGCVEEPCNGTMPDGHDTEQFDDTSEWHDHDQWSDRDPRQDLHRPVERQFETRSRTGPGTQPYWGTMRPYWNAPEPPGVIHRGARTRGFKK